MQYANADVRTRRRSLINAREPTPACEAFVPVRDATEPVDDVALFRAIGQILASAVTILVVATKL